MTISARSATWPAESTGAAPSLASASTAPRERLYTCTVWPAASSRCVIGRPILPRPTKPASTPGRVLPWTPLARRGDGREPPAGLVDLAGERVTNGVDDEAGRFEDAVQIDAVLDADAVEQVQQVFRSDVAGRARARKGTAAQAAGRAVEVTQAEAHTGHDVGQRHAPRVVKVHAPLLDGR